jgi:hypothetical protein
MAGKVIGWSVAVLIALFLAYCGGIAIDAVRGELDTTLWEMDHG